MDMLRKNAVHGFAGGAGAWSSEIFPAADRAAFCSFECTMSFAVDRIRQRREHQNEEIAELQGGHQSPLCAAMIVNGSVLTMDGGWTGR
jgi:hypothetical protein